jgi:GntR family transcriptional regulator, transcriptional repressor for pyruvate dehydrogenase complex
MPLREVKNRSLSDQVFDQLATEIVDGTYPIGTSLPAERTLAAVFKVNRHVVREALKRLEQVGLVRIAQGGGTRVLDPAQHAGLDLLALLAERPRGGDEAKKFWLSVLEMRACIAADAVRICAQRATPAIKNELVAITEQMSAAPDDSTLYALDLQFWRCVHDGAQNLVYRLAFNSLVEAADALGSTAHAWAAAEVRRYGFHREIARSISAGDAEGAESAMRTTMRAAVDYFRVNGRMGQRALQTTPPPALDGENDLPESDPDSATAKRRKPSSRTIAG